MNHNLYIADNGPRYVLAATETVATGEALRRNWTAAAVRATTARQLTLSGEADTFRLAAQTAPAPTEWERRAAYRAKMSELELNF